MPIRTHLERQEASGRKPQAMQVTAEATRIQYFSQLSGGRLTAGVAQMAAPQENHGRIPSRAARLSRTLGDRRLSACTAIGSDCPATSDLRCSQGELFQGC